MSRLDRNMLSQLLLVFSFFALVLLAVQWVNHAVFLFGVLIGDGQSVRVFLELSALTLPETIHVVVPVAALVATLYLTNRWMQDSELVAMQAAGMSPWRMARPVLAFGALCAVFMALLMHALIPVARSEMAEREAIIAQNLTGRFVQDGSFQHPAAGITLFVREVTADGAMHDVFLTDMRTQGQRIEFTARNALLVTEDTGPKLVMLDGLALIHDTATGRLSTTGFDDFTYDVGELIGQVTQGRRPGELSTGELIRRDEQTLAATSATPARLNNELARRFSYPLLPFAGVLIAYAALQYGGFNRLGQWRSILMAIFVAVSVELGNNAASAMALGNAALAAINFVPAIVGIAIGAALLHLSGRRRRVRTATAPDRRRERPA